MAERDMNAEMISHYMWLALDRMRQLKEYLHGMFLHPPKTKSDKQYYFQRSDELEREIKEALQAAVNEMEKRYGKTSNNAGEQKSSLPGNPKKE